MNLELPDEQTAALLRKLDRIIADDHYPLSPRIVTPKTIRAKLRPEPIREPLPPTNITSRREPGDTAAGDEIRTGLTIQSFCVHLIELPREEGFGNS
jgi:hypothetical protein